VSLRRNRSVRGREDHPEDRIAGGASSNSETSARYAGRGNLQESAAGCVSQAWPLSGVPRLNRVIGPTRSWHEPGISASGSWSGLGRPPDVLSASLRWTIHIHEETLIMDRETVPQSYRGVRCLSCRQPIPVPAILVAMDSALSGKGSAAAHEHPTRVFSLRCRACEREKPYRASDIMDFEGAPRTRPSRALTDHPKGRHTGSQSRGAKA